MAYQDYRFLAGFDSFVVCFPHLREILNRKGQNNPLLTAEIVFCFTEQSVSSVSLGSSPSEHVDGYDC